MHRFTVTLIDKLHFDVLEEMRDDFRDWLGEAKYMYGLTNIPPSRFTNSNSNGLWEFCPFLCGVGLMEALELAFHTSIGIWDRIPEPLLCMHLHNMLVQKGYIEKPVGLYASLQQFFAADFFADGAVPTSGFAEAVAARLDEVFNPGAKRRNARARQAARQAHSIHDLFATNLNRFYFLFLQRRPI